VYRDRFFLFAERGEAAAWVKNIRRNPEVVDGCVALDRTGEQAEHSNRLT
jgi:hypothetical protein